MTGSFGDLTTVSVNGTPIACRDQGRGDAVVFVHGSASDLRTWDGQAGATSAAGFRTISYSRRFARPNEDIPEADDDPMQQHVDDFFGMMEALDLPRAHVVGHSWGGFIAVLAAIQRPDMIRSLVLAEPPVITLFVGMPPSPGDLFALLLRRPSAALAIARFGIGAVTPALKAYRRGDTDAAIAVFGRGVLGPKSFAALSEERYQQVRDNNGADRAQLLGEGFPPLSDEEVRGIRVPALVVRGSDSPAMFRLLCERLGELLPASEMAVIAGASHLMHEDNPAAFSETLIDFLRRQSTGATD